jgi:putative PIN family toxin of toxin-antitoxin system
MVKRAVRVFLDSNVILSGLLSDRGAPRIILDILSLNLSFIAGITGRYNIIEIERNLRAKLPEAVPVYKEYVAKLNLRIIPVPALEEVKKYTGATSPKDVPVLVSAIKSKADYLITGDKKDFGKLKGDYPFKVTSPSEFLEIILPEILGQIKDTD